MIYGSVCSGIEAASVAWHPLGWRPAFFSEIEAFPRAVLRERYPDTPLHGDFTTIKAGEYAAINVLVGGTPCQSFSVAGLRKGLDDERGNLALQFCLLARRLGPKWVVWENVPGVLSLDGGRAFASILGGLAECGYGLAYRVLDAQFVRVDGFGRAVPQRRRRVFVVGHLGNWRRAAAVLFERASMSGHPSPRREPGQRVAGPIAGCSNGGGANGPGRTADDADTLIASTGDIAHCLNAGGMGRIDYESETMVAQTLSAARGKSSAHDHTLETYLPVAHALRADGFDASEDGTGRGTPIVPIAFSAKDHGGDASLGVSPTLRAGGFTESHANAGVMPAIAFNWNAQPDQLNFSADTTPTLSCSQGAAAWLGGWRVRRLTPTECERLQGFPDGYTAISYRGKAAADGPRYKALGNSMATNVMRWIGRRIEMTEAIGEAA